MQRQTIDFETPFAKLKVKLNAWINTSEVEYIEKPFIEAIEVEQQAGESEAGAKVKGSAQAAVHENAHRILEMFVTEISDGETVYNTKPEILKFLLNEVPDTDVNGILKKIVEIRDEAKKKLSA